MLIMLGSYRGQGLFARPICDLAVAMRPANHPVGPRSGASKALTIGILDNKTLDWVVKRLGLLPLPHHISSGLCPRRITDIRQLQCRGNARNRCRRAKK